MNLPIRSVLTLIAVTLLVFSASAQQTAFSLLMTYGGTNDDVGVVMENAAGNYVTAGYTYSNGQSDMVLMEISPAGTTLQQQSFGTTTSEFPAAICQAAGGYYIVSGAMYSSPNDYDWFVARLDASFNLVWFKRYGATNGNDYANSCYEVSPDHFVITGTVGLQGSAKPSVVLMDASGAVLDEGYLNTNQFASPNYRGRYLGNGEVGMVNLSNSLSILDTTGAVIKQGAISIATYTRDVLATGNGSYAMCGVISIGSIQGAGVVFAVADSNLNTLSVSKRINWSGYDLRAVGMQRAVNGNYVIAANALSLVNGNSIPLIIELSPSGAIISMRSYLPVGTGNVTVNSFVSTSDGGFLIGGGTGLDAYLAKLDSVGSCFGVSITTSSVQNPVNTPTLHSPFTGNITIFTPPAATPASISINATVLCVTSGLEQPSDVPQPVAFYPAAFTDGFHAVVSDGYKDRLHIELMDVTGRVVASEVVSGNAWINATGLSDGIYVVRAIDLSGHVLMSQKMIHLR